MMTKGKTILAGVLVMALFAALVSMINLPTIFAQGNGNGSLANGPIQIEQVKTMGGPGIPEIVQQAVDQGIISQEQADQLLASFQDNVVSFNTMTAVPFPALAGPGTFEFAVTGDGPFTGRAFFYQLGGDELPAQLPDDLQAQLQEAVSNGLLTQAEADQILADLQSGELNFLAITDDGVYTDPNNLPEGLGFPPLPEGEAGGAFISTNVNVVGGPGLAVDGQPLPHPFVAAGLLQLLTSAVNDGTITQAQADQIQALGDQFQGDIILFNGPAGTGHLPNPLLLNEVSKALQEAVSNGKVSQESADSLLQQLNDALGD